MNSPIIFHTEGHEGRLVEQEEATEEKRLAAAGKELCEVFLRFLC
jgi:hypothetical protein